MRLSPDALAGLLRPPPPKPKEPTSRERAAANRLRVLRTVAEHGHLRCTDLAAACWPSAKYAEQMAQRTVRALVEVGTHARGHTHGVRSCLLHPPDLSCRQSRPLRIEFPGAIYHVTSRGNRREPIYLDDGDRAAWLDVLAHAMQRFDAQVLAYCLMGNHYHVVLHTRQANLSELMRRLNGVYTQAFNRRHGKVGHLFQGRFKAILVDRETYLLELCRYVELNPVRAGMTADAADWPWSSYLCHVGQAPTPDWLNTHGLHGYLLARDPQTAVDHRLAARRYASLVAAGIGADLWSNGLRQQIYLGDADFAQRMQSLAQKPRREARDTPQLQRKPQRPLSDWLTEGATREEALRRAHTEGGLSMTAMARELGLSVSRVSRLIAHAESRHAAVQTVGEKAKSKT